MPESINKRASPAKSAVNVTHSCGGAPRGKTIGVDNPRAIVVKVTVALPVFDPSSVIDCGETAQPGPAGATVQVQFTV